MQELNSIMRDLLEVEYNQESLKKQRLVKKGCMIMANLVDKINKKHMKPNIPEFRVGDIVRVDVWVKEGKKERIQAFEGIVIARKGSGVSETFSVRKKSGSIGVVRVFPINTPTIDKITVVKKGMVRRAKLNFIKNMRKEYKVKERNSTVKGAE